MKKKTSCKAFWLLLMCLQFSFFYTSGNPITLTANGKTNYSIVVSANASAIDNKAANELKKYLFQISGVTFSITNDKGMVRSQEIMIGNNAHLKNIAPELKQNNLEEDGFVIQTKQRYLIITGGDNKGTLYGVYTFLETQLGCKMLAPSVVVIPKNKNITISDVNIKQVPRIKYRDLYYNDAYDSLYTDWHKLNHFDGGGDGNRLWGPVWSQSFRYIIPPSYFKLHPEYFALYKGKRIPDQLDLTNDDMFKEYVKNMKKLVDKYPASKIWSVAPNDGLDSNFCHCSKCEAINKAEGTPMGTLLNFVNKIASEFPDKTIATLAYLHYEEPPLTIKPSPNVMIVEAGSYDLNRSVPYGTATSKDDRIFRDRLNKWLALTKNIRIWDYIVDFPYLMNPFPNYQTLQPNIQFFTSKGITNIFLQGNRANGGDLSNLRTYVAAKLLWNPNENVDSISNDFLNSYYGKAGSYVWKYINLMTTALNQSNIPLGSRDHPHKHFKGYLAPGKLIQYNQLFDSAEAAVRGDSELTERVKVARLPLIYAMLEISKMVDQTKAKNVSVMQAIGDTKHKDILELLNYFVSMCKKHNIVKLAEYPTTIDSFQKDFSTYVKNNFKN